MNPTDNLPEPSRGATSTPTSSALGMVVDGRYRIVQPLAAGGMGSVYLGMQENLSRRVAIKQVSQPGEEDATRFRREAEALAAVSHPAIVEVHDYVSDPDAGVSYLIMAYVDGENLADYVSGRPGGVLQPLEALELMVPVASALVELHAHEILHRDIKPANLVRYARADGRAAVKLVDFGIARRAQDPGLTAEGLIVGTPPYLSPEVILGKGHSEASDVYAFGATLFELLTGDPPHGKEDLHHILKHATQEDVTLPPALDTTPLGALLLKVLDRADEGRPRMQAVLDELEQIRLSLLLVSDDPDAALKATRNISGGTLPPGFGPRPADISRNAVTAAMTPGHGNPVPDAAYPTGAAPQGAGPSGVAHRGPMHSGAAVPPGATALVAQPGEPARSGSMERLRAIPEMRRARSTPVVPWVVAGMAGVFAVVVTIILLVQDSGDKKPSPKADTPVGAGALLDNNTDRSMNASMSRSGHPHTRPQPRPRPRAVKSVLTGAALAKTTGELLASCSDVKKATSLFYRANRLRYQEQNRPWAKAAFAALLRCRHAIHGQKMWSAFRLAQLHAKDGECSASARAWRKWMYYGGPRKNPHLKQPQCTRSK